jgi:hypothetical protein
MALRLFILSTTLAFLPNALAAPAVADVQGIQSDQTEATASALEAAANEIISERWMLADRAQCAGQSCHIADLAGSTDRLPTVKPEGGDAQSYRCIQKWNPAGVAATQKARPVEKQNTGVSSSFLSGMNSLTNAVNWFPAPSTGKYTSRCATNIVIFAKGTIESGELGITVGPALKYALTGTSWIVVGVPYTADVPGDYCLGLPGGMVAKDMLNQAAQKCPSSKIFLSGYSQGAMVAHNAVAYADPEAKARVAVNLSRSSFPWPVDSNFIGSCCIRRPFSGCSH